MCSLETNVCGVKVNVSVSVRFLTHIDNALEGLILDGLRSLSNFPDRLKASETKCCCSSAEQQYNALPAGP